MSGELTINTHIHHRHLQFQMDLSILVVQSFSTLRVKLQKVVMKCKNVMFLGPFLEMYIFDVAMMMIMRMERDREFEAKRPHMPKKYHFIGQNQLK